MSIYGPLVPLFWISGDVWWGAWYRYREQEIQGELKADLSQSNGLVSHTTGHITMVTSEEGNFNGNGKI